MECQLFVFNKFYPVEIETRGQARLPLSDDTIYLLRDDTMPFIGLVSSPVLFTRICGANVRFILIPIRNMPTEMRQPFCPVVSALLAGMFLFGISIIYFGKGKCCELHTILLTLFINYVGFHFLNC